MSRSFPLSCMILLLISCSPGNRPVDAIIPEPDIIQSILIDEGSFLGPCEPSIAMDPSNPDIIVAGAILDNVYRSADGGLTWMKSKLESPYGVYGDPVICADSNSVFYYSHLSNPGGRPFRDTAFLDRIVVQKSIDAGGTWNEGSFTFPRSPRDQDKQWMAIDPDSKNLYMSWTEFDLYNSRKPQDHSRILFSRSEDDGHSWSYPFAISQYEGNCLDDDQTTEGAVPAIGLDGEIYIAWSYDNNIYFDRSEDGGLTWLDTDILISDQPGGWSYEIPGLMRCNGLPFTSVDRSKGPFSGRIYVNWTDQRNGSNDTDVWISYSDDKGDTWSAPRRVNDDGPGKHQFLSAMEVDANNGFIYIVFYDRRAYSDNSTDVYLAWSENGGKDFSNVKINRESFMPERTVFFGDYNDIDVVAGRVRPIWTEFRDGKLQIWTAIIH